MSKPVPHWVWSRLVPAKMADCWLERLHFLGEGSLVLHRLAGRRSARLEAYLTHPSVGRLLLARFGGSLRRTSLPHNPSPEPNLPIRIGSKFWIVENAEAALPTGKPARAVLPFLTIPAGIAFGTGRHATTGMLLREMATLPDWRESRVLDIGTGSGILALAARRLGATRIWALDTDPSALEVARRNETANFSKATIRWVEADLTRWRARGRFHRIVANLYLLPLRQGASRLACWLAPGGVLLVSGLLRDQAPEIEARFLQEGLVLHGKKQRGKWAMLRFGSALHCHSTKAPLP
ncbi:Ribosomal protein L11 methyltransferase [Methylacidimicrobium cyclopophantes]|uniref:Ribosomal protein L11 methyltransferase n=1 Tax=Methylacidimicrobium cyclopophantes TaxID=1041766 RepID=A0A5E6M6N2_9BACT|nr:50S ribosomal protein L11 methyltransferase [Methylacidimicrobium cyclopophantes]VVM04991.1 Ribosomal protein L11 methyltransferase [Methylacidimicrobium cyclopophantes]